MHGLIIGTCVITMYIVRYGVQSLCDKMTLERAVEAVSPPTPKHPQKEADHTWKVGNAQTGPTVTFQ